MSSGASPIDLPQTQKAPRTPSCPKKSSNRAVRPSIGFGPSSKDNKISPLATSTVSMECQIVHRWRKLRMKEFKEFEEFKEHRRTKATGLQEIEDAAVLKAALVARAPNANSLDSCNFLNSLNSFSQAFHPYERPLIGKLCSSVGYHVIDVAGFSTAYLRENRL